MQQIASGKERNYLFDNMKVLLTFFMVSAHYIRRDCEIKSVN